MNATQERPPANAGTNREPGSRTLDPDEAKAALLAIGRIWRSDGPLRRLLFGRDD